MAGYNVSGSDALKLKYEHLEDNPEICGYPFTLPEVYLNGNGTYDSKFPIFNREDDSVVLVRNNCILEYMLSTYTELLLANTDGETLWVEGEKIEDQEYENMKFLGEMRGANRYTITEFDLEKREKRTCSVTLDKFAPMTTQDYYRLSGIVDESVLGSYFEIKDGVLIGYVGNTRELIIPNEVTRIAPLPFRNYPMFDRIKIPKTVVHISDSFFTYCHTYHIEVDVDNPKYYSRDGFLIDKETQTLVWACGGTTIPNDGSVKRIGRNAFGVHANIENIIIPNVITEIEDNAFRNCFSLKEMVLPDVFANDAKRILGCSLIKDGDKWIVNPSDFDGFRF